jgi:formate-dependent nitrite reductase cytochrome c552 subunit
MISFRRNGHELYCESLWSRGTFVLARRLEYVWELYKKCKKECKTQYESELLCKLAEKEESIKDLESSLADSTIKERYLRDEVAQYRKILEEIKSSLK